MHILKKFIYTIEYIPKNLLILTIRIYQKSLSFDHAFWANPQVFRICMYHPSCSEYTVQALKKHGFVLGTIMGAARVFRCNPLARGGLDEVPDRFTIFSSSKESKN